MSARPYPDEIREQAIAMRRRGAPLAEVADLFGVAQSTVSAWAGAVNGMTPQQRARALSVANERRIGKARMREEVTSGALTLADAVFDDRADTLMVGDFLALAPGWGPTMVRKALGGLAVATAGAHAVKLWPWAKMGTLTHRQRKALRLYLAACAWRGGRSATAAALPEPEPGVDAQVVAEWLRREFPGHSIGAIERELGLNDGVVRRWFRGEQKQVTLTAMDQALTRLGRPDLLNALYPVDTP